MQIFMSDHTSYASADIIVSKLKVIEEQAQYISKSIPVVIDHGHHCRANAAKSQQVIKRMEEIFRELRFNYLTLYNTLTSLGSIASDLADSTWSIVWDDGEDAWDDDFEIPAQIYTYAERHFADFNDAINDLWDSVDDLINLCCIDGIWEHGRLESLKFSFPAELPATEKGDPDRLRREALDDIVTTCQEQTESISELFRALNEKVTAAVNQYNVSQVTDGITAADQAASPSETPASQPATNADKPAPSTP